jgi:hypothetical protein
MPMMPSQASGACAATPPAKQRRVLAAIRARVSINTTASARRVCLPIRCAQRPVARFFSSQPKIVIEQIRPCATIEKILMKSSIYRITQMRGAAPPSAQPLRCCTDYAIAKICMSSFD